MSAVDEIKSVLHTFLQFLPPLPSEQDYHDLREKIEGIEDRADAWATGTRADDVADDEADDAVEDEAVTEPVQVAPVSSVNE